MESQSVPSTSFSSEGPPWPTGNRKICPICGQPPQQEENHYVHYGGICCYSCRAFFRRANRRAKTTPFVCKAYNECVIDWRSDNPFCKKCRYDRCLGNNMNAELVLTEGEKKIRFKKYFKKKEQVSKKAAAAKKQQLRKQAVNVIQEASTSAAAPKSAHGKVKSSAAEAFPQGPSTSFGLEVKKIDQNQETSLPHTSIRREPNIPSSSTTIRCLQIFPRTTILPKLQWIPQQQQFHHQQQQQQQLHPLQLLVRPSASSPTGMEDQGWDLSNQLAQRLRQHQQLEQQPQLQPHLLRPFFLHSSDNQILEEGPQPIRGDEMEFINNEDDLVSRAQSYWESGLNEKCKVSKILDKFTTTAAKLNLKSNNAQHLIRFHIGEDSHDLPTTLDPAIFIGQLSMVAGALTEFASSLKSFATLPRGDQELLLRNNIPLFLQYISAKYFTAASGKDQLNWILLNQMVDCEEIDAFSRSNSLHAMHAATNFFPSETLLNIYSHYASKVSLVCPLSSSFNGIMANLILFHIPETILAILEEPSKIIRYYNDAKRLVNILFQDSNNADSSPMFFADIFFGCLKGMENCFGTCRVDNNRQLAVIPKTLDLHVVDAENRWLQTRLKRLQMSFRMVPPPQEFFRDVLGLLSRGNPVNSCFAKNWFALNAERLRQALKMHPEFSNLSDREQNLLLVKNIRHAVMLVSVIQNGRSSGKEQLKTVVGILDPDDRSWEEGFESMVDLDSLHVGVISDPRMNRGKLDVAALRFHRGLALDLVQWCSNPEIYQLFLLLTLLDVDGSPEFSSNHAIFKLRESYLRIYQRKLEALDGTHHDYAHFRMMLMKIKCLAPLLDELMA